MRRPPGAGSLHDVTHAAGLVCYPCTRLALSWRITVPGDQASDSNYNNLATGGVIFCDTTSSLAGCNANED